MAERKAPPAQTSYLLTPVPRYRSPKLELVVAVRLAPLVGDDVGVNEEQRLDCCARRRPGSNSEPSNRDGDPAKGVRPGSSSWICKETQLPDMSAGGMQRASIW
jgi:hypothetical protein